MAVTYTPISTTTLGSAQASVSFSSFSGYTDLVLVCNAITANDDQFLSIRFNGDTGTNYSNTYMTGDGSTASSGRNSNSSVAYIAGSSSNTTSVVSISQIENYSNSTTYKTLLSRTSDPTLLAQATVSLWRNSAAITSLVIASNGNISAGSTFTLYGILAA
jgi:hypothetical protein